jgi:hypothetical protein
MRARSLVWVVLVTSLVSSCRDDSTRVSTHAGPVPSTDTTVAASPSSPSSSVPATTSPLDAIRAQLATAATRVCAVVSAEDVRLSFHETAPLRTQPMGEASGPACGYPHPRQGGYLLVIQFQDIARWGAYVQAGTVVRGLGRDAVVTDTMSSQLVVLDSERSAVVVFLAPDSQPGSVEALLGVAAFAYGVPRDGVQVGA